MIVNDKQIVYSLENVKENEEKNLMQFIESKKEIESFNINGNMTNLKNIYNSDYKSNYILCITHRKLTSPYSEFFRNYIMLFISYTVVLISGIVVINLKYRKIHELLVKLSNVSGKNACKTETEYELINRAIKDFTFIKQNADEKREELAVKNALYCFLNDADESYTILKEKYAEWESNNFVVIMVDFMKKEKQSEKEKDLFLFILKNIFDEVYDYMQYISVVSNYDGYIVILDSGNEINNEEYQNILDKAEYIGKFMLSYTEFKIKIGISIGADSFTSLYMLYEQAYQALDKCKEKENINVVSFVNIKDDENKYIYTANQRMFFNNWLKTKQEEKAKEIIKTVYNENYIKNHISKSQGKLLLLCLFNDMKQVAEEKNIILDMSIDNIFEEKCSVKEVYKNIEASIEKICKKQEKEEKDSDKIIKDINEYIKIEYNNSNLSVALIAEVFKMNASYLSRTYKEKNQINLISYIAKYRIDKVKELLLNEKYTIATISDMCGFTNVNMMIRTFKKYEGVTPGQYRDEISSK